MKIPLIHVEIWDASIGNHHRLWAEFFHATTGPFATNFTAPATPDAQLVNVFRVHTRIEWIEEE